MCLCGDTHCSSCGPAQGNAQCYACGRWADDWDKVAPGPRGNAVTLTIAYQDICGLNGQPNCECPLCTVAWAMLPCDDPEECERASRVMAEQVSDEAWENWRDEPND